MARVAQAVIDFVNRVVLPAFGADGRFFGFLLSLGFGFFQFLFLFGTIGAQGRIARSGAMLTDAEAFPAAVAGVFGGVRFGSGRAAHVAVGRAFSVQSFIGNRLAAAEAFFIIGGVVRVSTFEIGVVLSRVLAGFRFWRVSEDAVHSVV